MQTRFGLVGKSRAFSLAVDRLAAAKQSCDRILLLGETGVGKDRLASTVYYGFRPESVAMILPSDSPAPLLSFRTKWLHIKSLERLNSDAQEAVSQILERHPNTKIIASARPEIFRALELGHFREDLFQRLAAAQVRIPPLRERRVDIDPLTRFFWEELSTRLGLRAKLLPSAIRYFKTLYWPGNLLQLKNVVQQIALESTQEAIGEAAIRELRLPELEGRSQMVSLKDKIDRTKREHIEFVINQSRSLRQAARELKISPQTLLRAIKSLKIPTPRRLPPLDKDDRFGR